MADDPRDKRRVDTPPEGVKRQIARPVEPAESWDEYTPVGAAPTRKTPEHGIAIPRTISDSEMLHHAARRAGEAKNVAIDAKTASINTLDRVEILRKETREDNMHLHRKVDAMATVVTTLQVNVGKQGVQNDLIIDMLGEAKTHRERAEHVITTTTIAKNQVDTFRQMTDEEIRKAGELTRIELAKKTGEDALEAKKESRKNFWTLVFKCVGAVAVVWAFVSVTYLSKCGQ